MGPNFSLRLSEGFVLLYTNNIAVRTLLVRTYFRAIDICTRMCYDVESIWIRQVPQTHLKRRKIVKSLLAIHVTEGGINILANPGKGESGEEDALGIIAALEEHCKAKGFAHSTTQRRDPDPKAKVQFHTDAILLTLAKK